jgi:aminoglycoside phosphotransferase (APT) family kinase protein
MSTGRMHPDEVETDAALVGRLIAAQFPQWADLPVAPVRSGGTVYALYRLGDDLLVRLPLRATYLDEIEKEHYWLPRFAPLLPLAIPVPLAKGMPGEGFPFPWSIYRWLVGEDATLERIADPAQAARDLARFLLALWQIDPTGGPLPSEHNYHRGVPLAVRDDGTRAAIATLEGMLDGELEHDLGVGLDLRAASEAWDAALAAPVWDRAPVWIHGDLMPLNMLAHEGRLSAVIDWGGLGIGDPACDVMIAWRLFSAESRRVFREALAVDEATWGRGRGWALSTALIALPYYHRTNPLMASSARHAIDEVIADYRTS